ncbi:hypothetical protein P8452_16924 [Trifolium repens]|nr:hypothetical protein P8452_16924 [Trifolium repens]
MSGHQSFFTNLNWIDWLFKNLKDGKLPRNVQSRMVNAPQKKPWQRISDLPFIRFRSPLHFYYLKEESLLLSLIDKKYLLNHNQHLLILIILKLHFLPFLLIKAKYSI